MDRNYIHVIECFYVTMTELLEKLQSAGKEVVDEESQQALARDKDKEARLAALHIESVMPA